VQKLTDQDPETQSADLVAGNIALLQSLFPEAFTEGKVDFEVLKQLLGGAVDDREEKYGLNWHGKRRARQIALTPSTGTLRPCPEESVDWDTTQNLMIEGDNLEVLKLLQKSYAGKVKLIYIDPPYNTGKDFVYPDDFRDNIKNYLELTGQVEGGKKISSNTEASGRFHTDWLNMMYPRLKLARNLLREDGVIFISIDDNEVGNLSKLCDEIFGPENLLTTITLKVRYEGKTLVEDMNFQKLVENVLVYAKIKPTVKLKKIEKDYDFGKFEWFVTETGKPQIIELGGKKVEVFSDCDFKITKGEPNISGLKEIWATGTILDGNSSGRFFRDYLAGRSEGDGLGVLYKVYGIGDDELPYRYFTGPKKSTATKGKYYQGVPKDILDNINDVKKLQPIVTFFDLAGDFGNCRHEGGVDFRSGKKPIELLRRLFSMIESSDSDLILDFFAGSGTTAHATMQFNVEDGRKRKFICIQLPEPIEDSEYKTIAELTKERLRRASKKIKDENSIFEGDTGFRVFKLDSSNIHAWEPNRDDLADTLLQHAEHLKTDRTEQDILFELLLKLGLNLTVPIEQKTISGKTVHSIGAGTLLTCLAPQISNDEAESLALGLVEWHKQLSPAGETQVVFRDSAFADDVGKTNLTAILQQNGLENVRSL